jgi:hypothetical protein
VCDRFALPRSTEACQQMVTANVMAITKRSI